MAIITNESHLRHILFKSSTAEDFNIQSGTTMTDYLRIYKIVIKYLSVIVLVFVNTINFSINGRSIGIRCITHDFALFLEVSVHFVLALCDKAPDIWKLIEKVVRHSPYLPHRVCRP